MVRPLIVVLARARGVAMAAVIAPLVLLGAQVPNAAAQDEDYTAGVWHYRSVACVNTTVRSVGPRLVSDGQKTFTAKDFESGAEVEFNTTLGSDPANPDMRAAVVHYQDTAGNNIMMRERPGDKVQVCFISRPAPTIECDPDKDGRGRVFRVYDYRQHAQYSGMNSEHGCGGA